MANTSPVYEQLCTSDYTSALNAFKENWAGRGSLLVVFCFRIILWLCVFAFTDNNIHTHTHPLADESQCKLLHFPACVCDFVEDIWKFRHYLEWKRTWIERHHDSSDFHMWLHFYLFFAVVLGSLRTHVTHTHTPHALTAVIRPLIFPSLPGFPGFLGVISNRAAPTSRGSCSSLCGSP